MYAWECCIIDHTNCKRVWTNNYMPWNNDVNVWSWVGLGLLSLLWSEKLDIWLFVLEYIYCFRPRTIWKNPKREDSSALGD